MSQVTLDNGLRAASRVALCVVFATSASAAAAANLTDLRIGVHGDHTRIVLETDGPAPYVVDANDREVVVHVAAAAAAEAVTATSPHLIWAKVEPTPIGADVRLQLKQPADVKAMVLTGPHRIVLDLYPRKGAAKEPAPEPRPAPELLPEPEEAPPPVTAEAEPGLPDEENEVPPPTPEELKAAGVSWPSARSRSACARSRGSRRHCRSSSARGNADPLASFPYPLTGGGYMTCGRRHEAVRHLEDALAFEKEDVTALYFMSVAKVALENVEEGIALAERAVTVSHRGGVLVGILGWVLATTGRTAEARALLGELQARPAGSPTVVSEAWLLGALGEIDAAFAVLDRAEEECQANLYFTGLPVFDPLRGDPRFTALLQRLGLPPEGRS